MLSEKFELDSPPVIRNLTPEDLARVTMMDYTPEKLAKMTERERKALISSHKNNAQQRFAEGNPFAVARDYLALYDLPGLAAQWREFKEGIFKEAASDLEAGDNDAAQEIELMMNKIEAPILLTSGAVTRDGVDGAVPNVPAFIQGNPFNMRTRRRDMTGRGPLSLFLETTACGLLLAQEPIMRTAMLLSFARLLSLQRPINLWFAATYGGAMQLTQAAVRIETTPLDIARVVPLVSHVTCLNSTTHKVWREKVRGSWAYGVPALERAYAGEILGRVVSPGSQIAYIGASYMQEMVEAQKNPTKWVRDMVSRFSPHLLEGTERTEDFGRVA